MRLRSFFLSARKLWLVATLASLGCGLLGILVVSANSFWDPGVLWRSESHRSVTQGDIRILFVTLFFMEVITGAILSGGAGAGPTTLPADTARARFVLTRPQSRTALLLVPLLLATAGLLCIPGLVTLFLLGWFALVHTPVLHHLVELARLEPAASQLGAHLSFVPLLHALHMGKRYLAGFSIGFCVVSIIHAQRWFIFSENLNIRRLAYVTGAVIYLVPAFTLWLGPVGSALLLLPPRGSQSLDTMPSDINIVLHLGFAAALCWLTARFIQKVEI
jgi:hypothetical protein